jgi:TPP-dependent pyruvate/acetoin dehydrogenase alpha subunit
MPTECSRVPSAMEEILTTQKQERQVIGQTALKDMVKKMLLNRYFSEVMFLISVHVQTNPSPKPSKLFQKEPANKK